MANSNYTPGVGALVLNRYDAQSHFEGTAFRHNSSQIDVNPPIVIDGYSYYIVSDTLNALYNAILNMEMTIPNPLVISSGQAIDIESGGNLNIIGGAVVASASATININNSYLTTNSGTHTMISGPLAISGSTTISGPLAASGSTTISGPLGISGATSISNSLTLSGPVTFSDITASGLLTLSGTTALSGSLNVGPGTISIESNGNLNVYGTTTIESGGVVNFSNGTTLNLGNSSPGPSTCFLGQPVIQWAQTIVPLVSSPASAALGPYIGHYPAATGDGYNMQIQAQAGSAGNIGGNLLLSSGIDNTSFPTIGGAVILNPPNNTTGGPGTLTVYKIGYATTPSNQQQLNGLFMVTGTSAASGSNITPFWEFSTANNSSAFIKITFILKNYQTGTVEGTDEFAFNVSNVSNSLTFYPSNFSSTTGVFLGSNINGLFSVSSSGPNVILTAIAQSYHADWQATINILLC